MAEFISNNMMMVAIFVMSGLMLVWPEIQRLFLGGAPELSTLDATRMMNQDAVVVDVREHTEFSAGHLPRARGIPLGDLEKRLGELERFKDKPVILVCANGMRSRAGARLLRQKEFKQVFNLRGGFAEWLKAALPTEK